MLKCVWHVFHHQRNFLINEWQRAWKSCHASWTRTAVMLLQSLYFSRFLPNRPRPLSSFDTHARWQPVTQSSRSRWSYGKIEDCEQSKICSFRPKEWQNLIGRWCWLLGKRTFKLTVSFVTQLICITCFVTPTCYYYIIAGTFAYFTPLHTLYISSDCSVKYSV